MKKLTIVLICILLVCSCTLPRTAGAAAPELKTVRVGWYESPFNQIDSFGRRSGYGYEYQQRIAAITGWKYEYVVGSWPELLEKLFAGEIDLLSDVSYSEDRAGKLLYSAQRMGTEDYHAFISPGNPEIRPDDLSSFNGKIVGINRGSVQVGLFAEWAEKNGITPVIQELSVKSSQQVEMLHQGRIDMMVALDSYSRQGDIVPVCKIGATDCFFGISLSRPDLKQELDDAMNRILEEDRYYEHSLAEKYNSSNGFVNFLTPEEKDWFDRHGPIRVGYRENYLPFCGVDETTGALTGALADYLSFAVTCEKNAQLSFEAVPFSTFEDALQAIKSGEIDCLFPVSLSTYDGELRDLLISDTFVESEMYAAVRTADRHGVSPDREMTVALVHDSPNFDAFLMDHFPGWKRQYYSDAEAGFLAVQSGAADCVLISSHRLNRLSDLCDSSGLSPVTTGASINIAFAVRASDSALYSILNKTLRLMPDSIMNASLSEYSLRDPHVTPREFLRDNLSLVLIALSVVLLIFAVLSLWIVRARQKADSERRLISATELDPLTRLYSRNFFFEYANRIHHRSPEPPMDAVVVDIEQFHSVNEMNGREFGDQVLRKMGDEIRDFLSDKKGIGSRFEADHFDLYVTPQEDYSVLLKRLQTGINMLSKNTSIRLRMGVAPWRDGVHPVQAFDRARAACSKVRGGKRHLMIYDDLMQRQEHQNQQLLNDLPRALAEHEFRVYYQPKYDIQAVPPKLVSVEALIRWQHPELGLIPPDEFIPLFEANGQIQEIDRYVWWEAVRKIAVWRDLHGITLPVSVNLSRVDALDPSLERTLDSLMGEFGLNPGMLHLEITESAYTENADQLYSTIGRLRKKGYAIEMDDFGSGYSSLSMLSAMPIDVLKMDRAFIRNIEHKRKDFRVVELILDVARSLQVPVVAEGVETEKQFEMLREAGCAMIQGYYFSRPLPAADFERDILKLE